MTKVSSSDDHVEVQSLKIMVDILYIMEELINREDSSIILIYILK